MLPQHLYLRQDAVFVGKQTTDQKTHEVRIELKFVDLDAATLGGYFEIDKLTEAIPQMCTYFEGEIIGDKFTFETTHKEWGATRESDLQHWQRFPQFGRDSVDAPVVYMRWKEQFLLPRDRELPGASFSGFYYMCLDLSSGEISGYYYQRGQAARERYQRIHLKYENVSGVGLWGWR